MAPSSATGACIPGRVSVVAPTTQERHEFHAQLWLCFHSQTYRDKELIVVDTGEVPSPFFKARGGGLGDVKYVHLLDTLTVGEKRNLAIREHSTGEIIANFDDDDLYFPAYLQVMVKSLTSSSPSPALTHLKAWTAIDLETGLCAVVDASKAPPVKEELLASAGDCFGFSMVYTKAAWQRVPWPDLTSGEDQVFLCNVVAASLPVVHRSEAGRSLTVLHLQHGGNVKASVASSVSCDAALISAMLCRFEEACRRIIKLSQPDYDEMGGSLLHTRLLAARFTNQRPAEARGLFLASPGSVEVGGNDDECEAWQRSLVMHRKHRALHDNNDTPALQRETVAES